MYRPLPDYLTIKSSNVEGLGLFALRDIAKGKILGITHVFDAGFENNYIRTPLGGFFNHSNEPNCKVIKSGRFLKIKTIKQIKADEELTAFYTLYIP